MKNKTSNERFFETGDIALTSFLLTKGIKLLEISGDALNRFSFILCEPEKCENLRRKFLNNGTAPAQELFSKREMLISEIKNKKFLNSC